MENSGGIQASLSGRYALALFELARDNNQLDSVAESLATLKKALGESAELRSLTISPVIGRDAATKAVAAVGEAMGLDPLTQREWEALDLDDIDDRIEDADTEIQDRQQDLKDAQEEFDKYKDLDENNDTRQTAEDDLEAAQEDYNEAVRNREEIVRERDTVRSALDALAAEAEARHQYEISSEGVNADELALAQSRLENAQAQITAAEASLSNFVLTAPFDGVVQEVAVRIGDQVSPEVRAIALADASSWIVETTDITELEVVNIAPGQRVTFTADALPDTTMEGQVTEVSQASYTQSGDVIYTVRILADEVDPRFSGAE